MFLQAWARYPHWYTSAQLHWWWWHHCSACSIGFGPSEYHALSEGSDCLGYILSLVPIDFGRAIQISTGGRSGFIPSRGAVYHQHMEIVGWHLFLYSCKNLPPPWCPQGSQSLILCFWVTFFTIEASLGFAIDLLPGAFHKTSVVLRIICSETLN